MSRDATLYGGLDLGQSADYSALAIVERRGKAPEWEFDLRHLQRWPLGTAYPAIVSDVVALCARLVSERVEWDKDVWGDPVYQKVRRRAVLAVDGTGVGAAVVRLRIASGLAEAQALVKELQAFKVKITLAGHDTYGAGSDWRDGGAHDDLVLACAIAVHAGMQPGPPRLRCFSL
jgi:hypothetical protein